MKILDEDPGRRSWMKILDEELGIIPESFSIPADFQTLDPSPPRMQRLEPEIPRGSRRDTARGVAPRVRPVQEDIRPR